MKPLVALLLVAAAACDAGEEKPVVPVDPATTAQVYDLALEELRRLMTPPAGAATAVNWAERMYLNSHVLLPPADSAHPVAHDSSWMNRAMARGLVRGVCGQPPAEPCPSDHPIGFTSLSPPWTVTGDTIWVQGGYAGETPGATRYEGVFWVFTLARDPTGALRIVRRGQPNRVTFDGR